MTKLISKQLSEFASKTIPTLDISPYEKSLGIRVFSTISSLDFDSNIEQSSVKILNKLVESNIITDNDSHLFINQVFNNLLQKAERNLHNEHKAPEYITTQNSTNFQIYQEIQILINYL